MSPALSCSLLRIVTSTIDFCKSSISFASIVPFKSTSPISTTSLGILFTPYSPVCPVSISSSLNTKASIIAKSTGPVLPSPFTSPALTASAVRTTSLLIYCFNNSKSAFLTAPSPSMSPNSIPFVNVSYTVLCVLSITGYLSGLSPTRVWYQVCVPSVTPLLSK